MSSEQSPPRASKLPFLIGDLLLLGCALLIYQQARRPLDAWELAAMVACVALGAWFAVKPFRMEYEAETRLAEARSLTDAVAQIQRVEAVAAQISSATAQWQGVQDGCTRAIATADALGNRMSTEAKQFEEFLQKANDAERVALRLEAEKLRRAEGDWLQLLVRVLDHVLALHSAAVRSGQTQVAAQITHFRDAILDLTRRVGLLPFAAAPGQPFDTNAHQRLDEKTELPPEAKVAETLAPGYTYQGQPVRRTLVRLEGEVLPESLQAPHPPGEHPPTATLESASEGQVEGA